jgi:hypothetical protein
MVLPVYLTALRVYGARHFPSRGKSHCIRLQGKNRSIDESPFCATWIVFSKFIHIQPEHQSPCLSPSKPRPKSQPRRP